MTVLETVRKYGLENMDKTYYDCYGRKLPLMNLSFLSTLTVKGFSVNFPTNECDITVVTCSENNNQ